MVRNRNYRKEYDNYFGAQGKSSQWTALHKKRRKEKSNRNQARRWYIRKYGKRKLNGVDIDHKNGNALDNRKSNLRMRSVRANRSRNKHKTRKYRYKK